ncbi:beta family protein [Streptomyces lydicus]|uniref:beta family protein n=1 Tax=Streptomyces lydicus TaxID=47763 RepID=UPI0032205902
MAYVPILKGKAGEFLALGNASAEVQSQIRPVMEVVPDCDVRDLLETFCDRAMEEVPKGMVLTVDCGALPTAQVLKGDAGGPMVRVGESLSWRQVAMCPVFRGADTDETLAEVRSVMAWHQQGGCLRISSAHDVQELRPDNERVREMLRTLHAVPEEIDLIVDAGPVHSRDRREALAVEVLETLQYIGRHAVQSVAGMPLPWAMSTEPPPRPSSNCLTGAEALSPAAVPAWLSASTRAPVGVATAARRRRPAGGRGRPEGDFCELTLPPRIMDADGGSAGIKAVGVPVVRQPPCPVKLVRAMDHGPNRMPYRQERGRYQRILCGGSRRAKNSASSAC